MSLPWRQRLRQWTWPEAFAIEAPEDDEFAELLGAALSAAARGEDVQALGDQLRRVLEEQQALAAALDAADSAPDGGSSPDAGTSPSLAILLGNQSHRLRQAVKMLGPDVPKGVKRPFVRIAEILDEGLVEMGVEVQDLADQVWDEGRLDFEPIAEPMPRAGLDRPRIGRCERPLIRLGGNIVQKAKGIVLRPE